MSSLWGGIGDLHPNSYSLSYLLYTNLSSQVKNNLLELIYSNSIQFYTIFDTTLMAESEEKLRSLLKVKEESQSWLKA